LASVQLIYPNTNSNSSNSNNNSKIQTVHIGYSYYQSLQYKGLLHDYISSSLNSALTRVSCFCIKFLSFSRLLNVYGYALGPISSFLSFSTSVAPGSVNIRASLFSPLVGYVADLAPYPQHQAF